MLVLTALLVAAHADVLSLVPASAGLSGHPVPGTELVATRGAQAHPLAAEHRRIPADSVPYLAILADPHQAVTDQRVWLVAGPAAVVFVGADEHEFPHWAIGVVRAPVPVRAVQRRGAVQPRRQPQSVARSAAALALADRVDADRFEAHVARLSGAAPLPDGDVWTTRATGTSGFSAMAEYVADELESYGCDKVVVEPFSVRGVPSQNVYCDIPGTTRPDEIVLVGSHLDSTSERRMTVAPGAEDNASGVAAMLSIAEILLGDDFSSAATVRVIAFGGEEDGLYGSDEHAQVHRDSIAAAVTMDMISALVSRRGVLVETRREFQWFGDLVVDAAALVAPHLDAEISLFPFGSDHMPFLNRGIPAVLLIDLDWGRYAGYHRTTDTIDRLDIPLGRDIAAVSIATVAELAETEADLGGIVAGIDCQTGLFTISGLAPGELFAAVAGPETTEYLAGEGPCPDAVLSVAGRRWIRTADSQGAASLIVGCGRDGVAVQVLGLEGCSVSGVVSLA